MDDSASLTRLETELVASPRPKIPLLRLLAVLRLLLALVELGPPAWPAGPAARRRATAANVSSRDTAEVSEWRLGTDRSVVGGGVRAGHSSVRLGTLTICPASAPSPDTSAYNTAHVTLSTRGTTPALTSSPVRSPSPLWLLSWGGGGGGQLGGGVGVVNTLQVGGGVGVVARLSPKARLSSDERSAAVVKSILLNLPLS